MNYKRSNAVPNDDFRFKRASYMTKSDVLEQYLIGKRSESSVWYRCPKTWTSEMVKFYTEIEKPKRNFDCREELKKIRSKYLPKSYFIF